MKTTDLCKECKHFKKEPAIGVNAFWTYCELLECKFEKKDN